MRWPWSRRRKPDRLHGHAPHLLRDNVLFHSSEAPQGFDPLAGTARGISYFGGLLQSDPDSPMLNFSTTESAIWTLNPDGSVYCRVPWTEVKTASLEDHDGEIIWGLQGGFFDHNFGWLRLQPMTVYRDALADQVERLVAQDKS